MTNHRSVSWSCLALFHMERLLSQLLDPVADIPVRNAIEGGRATPQKDLSVQLPVTFSPVLVNPKVTYNYQKIAPEVMVKHQAGYMIISQIFAVKNEVYLVAATSTPLPNDPLTRLPRVQLATEKVIVSLRDISHTCSVVRGLRGEVTIAFENK